MATSKANMLKQGANRTGRGLFGGMSSLNSRTEEVLETNDVTDDIEEVTEEVNKEPEEKPVVEKPKKEEKTVAVKEPKIEKKEAPKPVKEEITEVIEEINETINKPQKDEKKQQEKSSSRYEKEKFLLLDIRGYRDYVEHMAKASNMSATKYIRKLIDMDMKQNEDIYKEHKALEEKLRERSLK